MDNFIRSDRLASGYSALFVGDSDWTREQASVEQARFLSAEDLARQRIELGPYHAISWTGSRITNSYVFWEHCSFLTRPPLASPLTNTVAQAYHFIGEELPFPHIVDGYDYIQIPSEDFDMPTDGLADNAIARFLLGDQVEQYQQWLEDCRIPALPVTVPPRSLQHHYPEPFTRPLVMRCTDNWSGLVAINDLHHAYGTRTWTAGDGGRAIADETFTAAELAPYAAILRLESTTYTAAELERHVRRERLTAVFGPVLRMLRTGSTLPASHDTFAPRNDDE